MLAAATAAAAAKVGNCTSCVGQEEAREGKRGLGKDS